MAAKPYGPFPLQTNLRRLKPSLGRLVPVFAGLGVVLADDGFRDTLAEWLKKPEGWIVAGLLAAVALFLLAQLYLTRIYYNERGIGVVNAVSGSSRWHPYDELRSGDLRMRRGRRMPGGTYRPSSRLITLRFPGDTIRVHPEFYDSKSVAELLVILNRRFPGRFGGAVPGSEKAKPAAGGKSKPSDAKQAKPLAEELKQRDRKRKSDPREQPRRGTP
ncbi:MAG: hypothetical protein MAG453_00237 [Calditrichaeota bacterium]|nr:hypothetical protein [Calditrichota bacterium]